MSFFSVNGYCIPLNVKFAQFMVIVGRKVPFALVFPCLKLNG